MLELSNWLVNVPHAVLKFILIAFVLGCAVAQGQPSDIGLEIEKDVVECWMREPYETRQDILFRRQDLDSYLSIEELVNALLRLDFAGRQSVLEFQFPSDWNELEEGPIYRLRLAEYLSVSQARQAKCAADNYRDGDLIRRYSTATSDRREEGFVIMRDGRVVVRILTMRIIID